MVTSEAQGGIHHPAECCSRQEEEGFGSVWEKQGFGEALMRGIACVVASWAQRG